MATQMNFGKGGGKYKTAPEATTPVTRGQINFKGEGATRKASRSSPQKNFTGTANIPSREDPGQGQKQGTGSQGGY